ncbi:MAG: response regulator [Proteobacteria bacterium]|nr:response regulator [Pseudomonadota bacterium]
MSRSLDRLSEEKAKQIAVDLSGLVQIALSREFNFVSAVARDPEIREAAASDNYRFLQKRLEDVFCVSGASDGSLFMTDKNGIIRADADDAKRAGINVSDRPYFLTAKAGKASVGALAVNRATREMGVALCAPIVSEKHGFVGAAVVFQHIKFILNPINAVKLGKTGYAYLGNAKEPIVIRPDKNFRFKTEEEPELKPLVDQMATGRTGVARYMFRGMKKMAAFAPIPITGWNVIVTQNIDEIMAPVNAILNMIILVGLIFLAITVVSIVILSQKISTPAQRAIETLKQVTLHSGEMVTMIGQDKRIEFVNLAMEELMNRPSAEIIGTRPILTNINDIPEEEIWRSLDSHNVWTGRLKINEDASGPAILETVIIPLQDRKRQIFNYLEICRDITHELTVESRLRQAQKMESIGTLAGGIAHDFNNILTALMGYASLMQMKMDKSNPLKPYVDQILSASQKAADLTRSLSAFSRQQPVAFTPLNINNTIKATEKLLKRLLTEDIELRTSFAQDDTIVMADKSQMDQILFNLVTNARDAMPGGGTLTIETSIADIDDGFFRAHGFGKPGRYVLTTISDTGTGMDEATCEKIFDPFFTTKEVGKGTGLGLATVYGIIKQHDGYITVYSEIGHGTTFRIYLPAARIKVDDKQDSVTIIERGNETVLIAEDNEEVRSFMCEVLQEYGYKIIEATDGENAIDKFKQYRDIDLIVVDSVMPKKNGREAYEEIHRINPHIKVIFTSGHTKDVVLDKGIKDKEFDFIAKPLSLNSFLQRVREVLDR